MNVSDEHVACIFRVEVAASEIVVELTSYNESSHGPLGGTWYCSWFGCCAISRKVAVSNLSGVIGFVSFCVIFPDSGVDSASTTETSTWNLHGECGRRVRPATFNLSVSRLSRKCWILDISQACRPPLPVTRIPVFLLFIFYMCLKNKA
jgi:hypothetical protein